MSGHARILIAAPRSGAGKTSITCGLLRVFADRGLSCAAFKCGPDYIDPLFHERLVGAKRGNLDLFFNDEATARQLFVRGSQDCDLSVIEGVMGYYDGQGTTTDRGSSYQVAQALGAPAVLVVDAKGAALSLVALIKGMQEFRPDSHLCGVILNRCSHSVAQALAPLVESECGMPLLGFVPTDQRFAIESRHLGLVTAGEIANLQMRIDALADTLQQTVDIDRLLEIAAAAPALRDELYCAPSRVSGPVRLAIAQDDAFCFYYAENLRLLRDAGVQLVPFSPLASAALPADIDGLYIGGGYPELSAEALASNGTLRADIRAAIAAGMPTVAECGGFMYLQQELADDKGRAWPMVGALPGASENLGKLRQFGYINAVAAKDGLYGPAGTQVRAHEFHYWHSTEQGADFKASKPAGTASWPCIVTTETLVAGFPHVYWPANPEAFRHFIAALETYRAQRGDQGVLRSTREPHESRKQDGQADRGENDA